MYTENVLVLGGDLIDAHTIGLMTQSRVQTAVAYAQAHPQARLYAAAGIYDQFPNMQQSMAELMAAVAQKSGVHIRVIGPDPDFNTRGELRVFVNALPLHSHKKVISTWWHLPRVKRLVALEWGREAPEIWEYIGAPGVLSFRLAFLEILKWILTFVPERFRTAMVRAYRSVFGRSSW